jgi:hypothetical protein
MRKHSVWAIALALLLALSASTTFAACHADKGMGKIGPNGACPMWNAKAVKTITGEVVSLECPCPMQGKGHSDQDQGKQKPWCAGVTLKTATGNMPVCLGPDSYLAENKFALKLRDRVTVIGGEIGNGKTVMLIAKQIRRGNQVLALRDDNGKPKWAAGAHKMGTCPMKGMGK